MKFLRLFTIQRVLVRYGLDRFLAGAPNLWPINFLLFFYPGRWLNRQSRALPRGERIRRALEELGPVFVKHGQIISTRRDLLPDDIADELAKLQDNVPPFSSDKARQTIEQALQDSVDNVFNQFSHEPLASASIAQVHEAQLKSGQRVIVKVLRPDIEQVINRDLSLMYTLAGLAEKYWADGPRLRPSEVVAEFEKIIFDELDLVREAANAAQLRRNFENTPELYVPEVFWDLTRKNVLVMEQIHGIRVSDIDALTALNVDKKLLAERGVEVFFTQVFRDNFFHADMHPGNIFVDAQEPENPRYIAVDFGIVGSLTREDRHYLAENFLAFFKRDYRRVAQLHVDSGWVPEGTRVEDFESAIRTVCEPIFEKPLEEISFGHVLLRLFQTARRFNMEVQPQLVLLQKTLLNIEGLGRQLYPQLDLWATAKPFLERWVGEQKGPIAMLKRLGEQAPEWAGTLPEMPLLLHSALKKLADAESESAAQQQQIDDLKHELKRNSRRNTTAIGGAAFIVAGALTYGLDGYQTALVAGAPILSWLMGSVGLLMLVAVLR
ncbi:MAG: ubiquinone biosynthesis regulatory protein kinase UbiB [Pseudomonadota bacterium]